MNLKYVFSPAFSEYKLIFVTAITGVGLDSIDSKSHSNPPIIIVVV